MSQLEQRLVGHLKEQQMISTARYLSTTFQLSRSRVVDSYTKYIFECTFGPYYLPRVEQNSTYTDANLFERPIAATSNLG
jgi:hypothetical protein